jgi:TRAP-type mannitol/chloroaromatic compound transport system permease large subunit
MRASLPPESKITMVDIYMAAIPFIFLQILCIVLVMLFPSIATFLPTAL